MIPEVPSRSSCLPRLFSSRSGFGTLHPLAVSSLHRFPATGSSPTRLGNVRSTRMATGIVYCTTIPTGHTLCNWVQLPQEQLRASAPLLSGSVLQLNRIRALLADYIWVCKLLKQFRSYAGGGGRRSVTDSILWTSMRPSQIFYSPTFMKYTLVIWIGTFNLGI